MHARADSQSSPPKAARRSVPSLLVDDGSVRTFLVDEYGARGERARFEFVSGDESNKHYASRVDSRNVDYLDIMTVESE